MADPISPDDIDAARDAWLRLAPKSARQLMNAKRRREREQQALLALLFLWDAAAVRFVRGDGRNVDPRAVKAAVIAFSLTVEDRLTALAGAMVGGTIGIPEWQTRTAHEVAAAHLAVYAIGTGGMDQLTVNPRAMAGASDSVGFQLDRFRLFVATVKASRIANPAAVVSRAALYGVSIPGTFEEAHNGTWAAVGTVTEMRNVLDDAAMHCGPRDGLPGCPEETDRGWVAVGEMSTPGSRACGPRCRCYIEYRKVTP